MAVSTLDAFQISNETAPSTFAISAGNNRLAIVGVVTFDGSDAAPATAVTLGGQSFTKLGEADDAGSDVTCTFWVLDEAGVAARTDDSLSITLNENGGRFAVVYGSLQDASQALPSGSALVVKQGYLDSDTLSLVRAADSVTVVIQGHDLGSEYTSSDAPAHDASVSPLGAYRAAYGVEVDTDRTADFTWSHGTRDDAAVLANFVPADTTPLIRKSSTFDIETELSGTVTDATLDGNAITVDSQDGTTVTLTDSDGSITTSGEYDLVLTDDSDPAEDETITVQVNVFGITPSNNPVQKDGSAQTDLTDVEIRVTDGSALDGTQLYYTATAATDASGNLSNIDLSDTSAADGDPVVLTMRTAAGDGLPSDETVGLI